jgi:hypothetical protein
MLEGPIAPASEHVLANRDHIVSVNSLFLIDTEQTNMWQRSSLRNAREYGSHTDFGKLDCANSDRVKYRATNLETLTRNKIPRTIPNESSARCESNRCGTSAD